MTPVLPTVGHSSNDERAAVGYFICMYTCSRRYFCPSCALHILALAEGLHHRPLLDAPLPDKSHLAKVTQVDRGDEYECQDLGEDDHNSNGSLFDDPPVVRDGGPQLVAGLDRTTNGEGRQQARGLARVHWSLHFEGHGTRDPPYEADLDAEDTEEERLGRGPEGFCGVPCGWSKGVGMGDEADLLHRANNAEGDDATQQEMGDLVQAKGGATFDLDGAQEKEPTRDSAMLQTCERVIDKLTTSKSD